MSDKPSADSIFLAAVQLQPDQRTAYLTEVCGDDGELRARVERLLAAQSRVGSFLESPAPELGATVGYSLMEQPGTLIGPYKLLQQIGEGGMGVVFMAEQNEPFHRIVALKIIKPGMHSRQVVARFEAERQALAMMDHPNIATVLDAGTTDSGRPYFVMELVKGVPITTFCDEKQLSLRERLALFLSVCQAVQHAHQKGVIHRDIKPTNVLVAEYDHDAVPKVIDFGVAKAIAQKLTERTMFTEFGQLVGTFEYMSPEQAKLNQIDIDTRSDIYSLGVLLYELLTGATPFERKHLHEAAFDEMLRIIREEEPPKPSTKLSTSQALASIAANRRTEPAHLSRAVRGDLDWIVMKSLEKERNRRYETASNLASDVERYLADRPVEACPPSAAYRLRKLARRNKGLLATTSILAAVLLGATLVSSWQAVRALRAERRARSSAARALASERAAILERDAKVQALYEAVASAERAKAAAAAEAAQLRRAEEISTFLVDAFSSPDPLRDGRTITIAEVLDRAAKRVQTQFADDPATKATLLETIAQSYNGLGLAREAISVLEKAREIRQRTPGSAEDDVKSTALLAIAYDDAGQVDEAIRLGEVAAEQARKALGTDHPTTLNTISNLAAAYKTAGRLQEALELQQEALLRRKSTLGPKHADTLHSIANLATVYHDLDRMDAAIPLYEEAFELAKEIYGPNHPHTLSTMNNLGLSYDESRQPTKALPMLEQSLQLHRQTFGMDHPNTLTAMGNLACAYADDGRLDKALALQEDLFLQRKAKLGLDHPETLNAMSNVAMSYVEAGNLEKAVPLLEENLRLAKVKLELGHPHTIVSMVNLAAAYRDVDRLEESLPMSEEALKISRSKLGDEHSYTIAAASNLGATYAKAGRHGEALPLFEKAMQGYRTKFGDDHLWTVGATRDFAGSTIEVAKKLKNLSRPEEAVVKYARAIELLPRSQDAWVDRWGVVFAAAESDEIYERLARLRPGDRTLHIGRLHHLASLRKWDELGAVSERLIGIDPSDHYSWYNVAPLHLYLGDTTTYRRFCAELLSRFGETDDPTIAERVAKTCFLAPDAVVDLDAARKLAERAISADSNHPFVSWFYLAKAMGDYRAEDFESTIRSARRSVEHRDFWPYLDSTSLLFEAMAEHRLGHLSEARESMAKAQTLMRRVPDIENGDLGSSWPDALRLAIVRLEAEALFGVSETISMADHSGINQ